MKNVFYSLGLLVIVGLILISCSPSASSTEQSLLLAQATQSTADLVTVELTVQYDTAAVYNTVGQIIRFKYIVKMVKNDLTDNIPAIVTISGISAVCPDVNSINNLNDRFDPGEVLECSGDYIITQADLDNGSVTNTATASVYSVNSNTVNTTVPTVPARALALTVSASPNTYSQAGQTITYAYTIKNSGSSQLGPAQFMVTDALINNGAAFNCGDANVTIAPEATVTCTNTYQITANDLNATTVSNNATASGGDANPSQQASSPVTKTTSTSSTTTGSNIQHTVREGEWLWQIARCYGADPAKTVAANTQLSNTAEIKAGMIVTVPNVGSKGTVHAPPEPCVTKHLVQSGDTWSSIAAKYGADAGLLQIVNASTLTVGKEVKVPLYTAGLNIPVPGSSTTVTAVPSTTALTLSVTPSSTTYSQADQQITLNFVIKNSGNTTLGPAQFTVTDGLFNPSTFNCGPSNTTLSPGASTNCTMNYTITQTDMGAASIQFNSTASGGGAPTSPAVGTTISKAVSLITLSVTSTPTTYSQAEQIITFNFTIKNDGTTTLGPAQFTVTDSALNPSTFNCGSANTTLEPGATTTCVASYTISQADMGAVNIQFNATAVGGGAPPSQAVSTTVTKQ